jgi:IS30 family transposase
MSKIGTVMRKSMRLTDKDVKKIVELSAEMTCTAIAQRYGVAVSTIARIVRGAASPCASTGNDGGKL